MKRSVALHSLRIFEKTKTGSMAGARMLSFLVFFTILAVLVPATAFAQPVFTKVFTPDTVGPGSAARAVFTIDNTAGGAVTDMAFSDTLPAVVTVADPAMASTDCVLDIGGSLSAPAGGSTISLSGAQVGAGGTCTVNVSVTSTSPGAHTNPAVTLSTSAGSSMSAPVDLTVDPALPGFTKSFSPASVVYGGRSTLTFTVDNTASAATVGNLDFTDTLPPGMVVADPSNAVTDCVSSAAPDTTFTADPGTDIITLDASGSTLFPGFEVLGIGATCTATVDVIGGAVGMLDNLSGDLLADFVSSGMATDTLDVTAGPSGELLITKSFTDDAVPPGNAVTLEFTILNRSRADSATNLAFTDDLNAVLAGLLFDSLLANSCGGTVTGVGTGQLGLTGGTLAPESSCTLSASLQVPPGAANGSYPNVTTAVTADIGGSPVTGNAASEFLFVAPVPLLTKTFVGDPVSPGDDVTLRFTIDNTSTTSGATDIAFIDELTDGGPNTGFLPFPVAVTLPPVPDPPCGAGSSLGFVFPDTDRQGLELTGGSLAAAPGAGSSCTFEVTVTIPTGMPTGTYLNTTEVITATVDDATVTGQPASDTVEIIAAPRLTKEFTDDPAFPGGTVSLEFTLIHDALAPGDATAVTFSDDLTFLAGLTATGLPLNDLCGPGNGTLSGSAGDTLLTFSGATLTPGQTCTFPVTLQLDPAALPGTHTNTTSNVTATILGVAATGNPASDDILVTPLTFTKEFLTDPVIPGGTTTLRFTLDNTNGAVDAGITFFTDNLAANLPGLAATGGPTVDTCGGTLSGTTFLTYVGGSVTAGVSCTIEVPVLVPSASSNGTYLNVTSSLVTSIGTLPPAADSLTVNSNLISLTKAFTDDPVPPGGTVNLNFSLANLDPTNTIADIAFSDDLNAALTGLLATGLPAAACGGTVSTPDGGMTVEFSGGSLEPVGSPGDTCTFDVTLQVPLTAVPANFYTNTTSAVAGVVGTLDVDGDPASDDLRIEVLSFSKSFAGPTGAGGTTVLTFTIDNLSILSVADLSFSDNLDAVIPGLVATGLPASDVCGPGSLLAGTGFLTLTGGSVPASGFCTFDVTLQVPPGAPAGAYPNTTSDLFVAGFPAGSPATASLTVVSPPTVVTDPATAVSFDGATLNGTVNANGTSTVVTFEYGLDTDYGTTVTADQSPVTGITPTAVTSTITGLAPSTTYHYRAVGESIGAPVNGADMTFTTMAAPTAPTAATGAATAVTVSGATLNGIVNAGNDSTTVTFEYGIDTGYGMTVAADQSPVTGGADTAVTASIGGLASNTLYHYRVVGQNANGTATGGDMTFATLPGAPVVYFSFNAGGRVGGVRYAVEDILSLETATGTWAKFFDGSDVGLGGINVNGFHRMDDGSLLLSIAGSARLAGARNVTPNDVVRFIPESTGPVTAGTFEMYFDGSDVGLTRWSERTDAVTMTPDGRLVVSTGGRFRVPGIMRGRDEDLAVLNDGVFGRATSGTWEMYFDGSDVRLVDRLGEDVWGATIDPITGELYLTTSGFFRTFGITGEGSDILLCSPFSPGPDTLCGFSIFQAASPGELDGKNIDALFIDW